MAFNLQQFTHTLGSNIIIITSIIYTGFKDKQTRINHTHCVSSFQLRRCDRTDFSEPPAQFEHELTKHVGQLITNNEHSSMRTECFQTPGALWQLPPCCCDVLEKVTPGSISGIVHGNEIVFGNSQQRCTLSAVLQPLRWLCIFSLNAFFFLFF